MSSLPPATYHTSPPPCPDHLRPPRPPELRPTPVSLAPTPANPLPPAKVVPALPPSPTTPANLPVEGGVFKDVVDVVGMSKRQKLAYLRNEFEAFLSLTKAKGLHVNEDTLRNYERTLYPKGRKEGNEQDVKVLHPLMEVEDGKQEPKVQPDGFMAAGIVTPSISLAQPCEERASEIPIKIPATGNTIPVVAMGGPAIETRGSGQTLGLEGNNISKHKSQEPSLSQVQSKSNQSTSVTSSLVFVNSFSPQNKRMLSNSNFAPSCSSTFPPNGKDIVLKDGSSSNIVSPLLTFSSNLNLESGQSQPLTGQLSPPLTEPNIAPCHSTPFDPALHLHPCPEVRSGHLSPSKPPGAKDVPKSWSSLLRNSIPRMSLNFIEPSFDKEGLFTLEEGTSIEGEEKWKTTIVGYSIGKRIPFKLLHQQAMKLWGQDGLKEVRVNKDGFYFFSFSTKEGMDIILSKGPWTFYGEHFFLKAWSRKFDFSKEEFKTVPTWVKLFGVPTTYWSNSGLSAIASKLGVPLYADEITSEAKILEFARVCVEMKVSSDFPHSFTVQTEHNEDFEIRVEYGWKPKSTVSNSKIHPHSVKLTSYPGAKASAIDVVSKYKPREVMLNTTPSESMTSNSFLALSRMEKDEEEVSGNVPCQELEHLVGVHKLVHNTNGNKEGALIEAVNGLEGEEGACLDGKDVGEPSRSNETESTEEGGKAKGQVTSPREERLELKITSEEDGEWTPVRWGKKRLMVDEVDKMRIRKMKGKVRKGSRVT